MALRVDMTIEIDPEVWAAKYRITEAEVREDVRVYLWHAIQQMPVTPMSMTVKEEEEE